MGLKSVYFHIFVCTIFVKHATESYYQWDFAGIKILYYNYLSGEAMMFLDYTKGNLFIQGMLTHWTKKIIVEEGHSLAQLVHIL